MGMNQSRFAPTNSKTTTTTSTTSTSCRNVCMRQSGGISTKKHLSTALIPRHPSSRSSKKQPRLVVKTESVTVFSSFDSLSDDLVLEVLSYVSYGPSEFPDPKTGGTLAHTFPFVSRRFHQLCNSSDYLWLQALQRLVHNDPESWQPGLLHLLRVGRTSPPWSSFHSEIMDGNDFLLAAQVANFSSTITNDVTTRLLSEIVNSTTTTTTAVLKNGSEEDMATTTKRLRRSYRITKTFEKQDKESTNSSNWCRTKKLYCLLPNYRIITFPVFYMPYPGMSLKQKRLHLHFYEERYCRLAADITHGRSQQEMHHGMKKRPFPQFVFAHCSPPLAPGKEAFLVEVILCRIYPDGSADLTIRPLKEVIMTKIIERPRSGGLCDAWVRVL